MSVTPGIGICDWAPQVPFIVSEAGDSYYSLKHGTEPVTNAYVVTYGGAWWFSILFPA